MDDYEDYENGGLLHERYKKISDISEGSYGMVSVAKDIADKDKVVAIKYIYPVDFKKKSTSSNTRPSSSPAKLRSPNLVDDSIKPSKQSILKSLKDEAQKEIRIHKLLGNHPNISTLYDHFESFLVLEFCSRGDLYEAIQNGNGPSTSQDVKDVFMQIISALEYCHSHSVYHRDLKPENILIAQDWSIKLCDWGLATTTKVITNKDEFDIGSERYMAPELFDTDIESYDASKIDIWSIGIILLTLVFHKNPFQVANYSDKRFIQFVNNREALFDIFSTMSGEMFSVLRYSLNIDPTNRDLANIKSELGLLKYFTIDEEYWGSEFDDEEDELDESAYSEEEDNRYYNGNADSKEVSISPAKKLPAIITSDVPEKLEARELPGKLEIKEPISVSPSNLESGIAIRSDKPRNSVRIDDAPIPHNHRADALLSTNSSLKPIPIGGTKFIRNTRKPFNVASFNQSHNGKFNNSYKNFNREDFFTPKSIFNHYMDKYGEQRFNNNERNHNGTNGNHQNANINENRNHNGNWKRNYKKQKWRKNKKKPQNDIRLNENGNSYSIVNGGSGFHGDHGDRYNRRKSTLHAVRPKKPALTAPTMVSSSLGTTITTASTTASTQSNVPVCGSAGKYIPPYLRSPGMKSPDIEPLSEEIDKLNLSRDLDEVFHLEDDFEFPATSNVKDDIVVHEPNDFIFKRMYDRTGGFHSEELHESNGTAKLNIVNGVTNNNPVVNCRRNSALNRRPLSTGHSLFDVSTLSTSASSAGKYVPPFRRGSHCSGMQSTGKIKAKRLANDDCITGKFSSDEISSSVPSDGNWLNYKKDWSDYD